MFKKFILISVVLISLFPGIEPIYALRPMAGINATGDRSIASAVLSGVDGTQSNLNNVNLDNAELILFSDKGQYVETYEVKGNDRIVVKIIKEHALNVLGEPVDFDRDIAPGVQLASLKLGALAAETAIVRDLLVFINGKSMLIKKAIIQQKVMPSLLYLKSLVDGGELNKAKAFIEEWVALQESMWAAGVLDQDIKISKYGFDEESQKCVAYDFTCLSADKETRDVLTDGYDIVNFFRVANVVSLNAISPELGNHYLYSNFSIDRFNQLWPKESIKENPMSEPVTATVSNKQIIFSAISSAA